MKEHMSNLCFENNQDLSLRLQQMYGKEPHKNQEGWTLITGTPGQQIFRLGMESGNSKTHFQDLEMSGQQDCFKSRKKSNGFLCSTNNNFSWVCLLKTTISY